MLYNIVRGVRKVGTNKLNKLDNNMKNNLQKVHFKSCKLSLYDLIWIHVALKELKKEIKPWTIDQEKTLEKITALKNELL